MLSDPRRFRVTLTAVLVLGAIMPAVGQVTTGTIEGIVVDQTGARLAGVTIRLQHASQAGERTVISDVQGFFHAPLLPVGVYALSASRDRFRTFRQPDILLTVGQTITLRLELSLAVIADATTVMARRPLLETTRSHASATVDDSVIRELPINGRSFIDFVLLTPGVTRDRSTGDLSFAGQRGTFNSLVVDGADNNNTFAGQPLGRVGSGRAPYQFSQEAVQEFQINSHAYSAEYGQAAAGVINVVTRSGTNTLHGSLLEFYRDKALNATNVITRRNGQPKDSYHYHQFGGTLGGPVRAGRDFFFSNYDGQRNRQPNPVFFNVPQEADDPDTRAAIDRLRPLAFSWSRRLDQDVYLGRTDHQITRTHRLTVRYNHQNLTGDGLEAPGPVSTFEHTGAALVRTRTLVVSWSGILAERVYNELRAQYARDHEPSMANSDAPEAVIRHNGAVVLAIGRNSFSPRDNRIDRLQVANVLTWLASQHQWKAGVDVQIDRIENFFPGRFFGRYEFHSLASFHRGRPNGAGESYLQNFAGPGTTGPYTNPDLREFSLFVQDTWRLSADFTANLGLRYDVVRTDAPTVRNPDPQLAAAGIDTSRLTPDTDNWGPRAGIAWSPEGGPYVVRGGGGIFYGRVPAIVLSGAHANNGVNVVALRFTGARVPTYPERFPSFPTGGEPLRPSLFFIERLASPRLTHASVSLESQLGTTTTVTATYLFARGTDLPRTIDLNIGSRGERIFTVSDTGEMIRYPFFGADRPFDEFDRVSAYSPTASSMYHGMTLDVHRRIAGNVQFRAAYTLSRVDDTAPDATAVLPGGSDDAKYPPSPVDDVMNRAAGNNDQRHRLVGSGVLRTAGVASRLSGLSRRLADAWTISAILTAQSGLPFSARVGSADLNGDRNSTNDLAPGTRRNGFRLPSTVTLDVRIARAIPVHGARIAVIAEVFNLLNRANINTVEANYYTVFGLQLRRRMDFDTPRGSAGERIAQLAARVSF